MSLVLSQWPIKACGIQYEKRWSARRPGPARGMPYVVSTAYVFKTEDGARSGLAAAPDLLGYSEGIERAKIFPRPERPAVGDEASVAFTPDAFALGAGDRPGVAVFWRRGAVLGTVFVVGRRESAARPIAASLAVRQDARIAKPTPLRPSEIDDRAVPLDDPRLDVRPYWLGRRFAPGHGLPALRLLDVLTTDPRDRDEAGFAADVGYEGKRDGVGLRLWKASRWVRFRRSRLGRGFWDEPCARRRVVALRHGHADLFRSCAKRRPRFVGIAYLPGAVVDFGSYCLRCGRGDGAYGSFKGLTAVARALRPRRPKR